MNRRNAGNVYIQRTVNIPQYILPVYFHSTRKWTWIDVSLIEVREKKGQDEAGSAGQLCRILGYTSCFSDDLEAVET